MPSQNPGAVAYSLSQTANGGSSIPLLCPCFGSPFLSLCIAHFQVPDHEGCGDVIPLWPIHVRVTRIKAMLHVILLNLVMLQSYPDTL